MAGGIEAIRQRINTLRNENERLEEELKIAKNLYDKERAEKDQVSCLA